MTRYTKSNGKYSIHGHKYEMLCGSRAQVWHKTAYKTSGDLKKHHLMKNKSGRIVSRAKHATAKKEKRLVKSGYGTKKGKFGFVLLNGKEKGTRKKRQRGGQFTKRSQFSQRIIPYCPEKNRLGECKRRQYIAPVSEPIPWCPRKNKAGLCRRRPRTPTPTPTPTPTTTY